MIIYTQRPPDSVSRLLEFAHQGQRRCSNYQGTIMKRTKRRYSHAGDTQNKCWGEVRSFAPGSSTVFLWNRKKRYAGLILHQCLYMLVFMLFFFYLVFYSLPSTFWLILLATSFKEAVTAAAARFPAPKSPTDSFHVLGWILHVQAGYCK